MKKVISFVVFAPIALGIFYGAKHIAHKKCVEASLELVCKNHIRGFESVDKIDVAWFSFIAGSNYEYPCTATIKINGKPTDIKFTAKKVTIGSALGDVAAAAAGKDVEDDWEVNYGIWGWLGDDYRIQNIEAK